MPSPSPYRHFDGMAWPNPDDPSGVEWELRYGTPTREDLLVAASFIGAYKQLTNESQRVRNQKISRLHQVQVQGAAA